MRFRLNNPVLDYMNTMVQFIGLNLVYLICCLPIITIGPATAALYQVTLREARHEHGYLIKKFFVHMKEMFFQGIAVSLVFFFAAFILAYSFVFWNELGGNVSLIATILSLLFAALLSFGLAYVFPLMARFQNTTVQTMKNAFFIALTNMKYTLILVLIHVFVISLFFVFPAFKIIMLLAGFSFTAFLNSWILTKVFRNYEPAKTQFEED